MASAEKKAQKKAERKAHATAQDLHFMKFVMRGSNSIPELFLQFFVGLAIAAALFAIFEEESIWDSLWWAVVTATTTGYGDISPGTLGGRLTGAALMLFSILWVLPLLIGRIASHLIENPDAFTHAEQEEILMFIREQQRPGHVRDWPPKGVGGGTSI